MHTSNRETSQTCSFSPMLLPMPLLLLPPSLGTKKPTTRLYVVTTKPKIGQAKMDHIIQAIKAIVELEEKAEELVRIANCQG